MKALKAAVAAVAVASALTPAVASAAFSCPEGWFAKPTSITNPTTGQKVYYCWPMS